MRDVYCRDLVGITSRCDCCFQCSRLISAEPRVGRWRTNSSNEKRHALLQSAVGDSPDVGVTVIAR